MIVIVSKAREPHPFLGLNVQILAVEDLHDLVVGELKVGDHTFVKVINDLVVSHDQAIELHWFGALFRDAHHFAKLIILIYFDRESLHPITLLYIGLNQLKSYLDHVWWLSNLFDLCFITIEDTIHDKLFLFLQPNWHLFLFVLILCRFMDWGWFVLGHSSSLVLIDTLELSIFILEFFVSVLLHVLLWDPVDLDAFTIHHLFPYFLRCVSWILWEVLLPLKFLQVIASDVSFLIFLQVAHEVVDPMGL